jgi:hypothetical protein
MLKDLVAEIESSLILLILIFEIKQYAYSIQCTTTWKDADGIINVD